MNSIKLKSSIPTFFSVSSPELAFLAAQIVKEGGGSVDSNLELSVQVGGYFFKYDFICLRYQNNTIGWFSLNKHDLHIQNSLDLLSLLTKTEPKAPKLPQLGGFETTADKDGIKVGCTSVSWEELDEIIEKTNKYRVELKNQ